MLEKILSYDLINYHSIHVTTESVLKLLIVWLVTKLILILIKKAFKISGKKRSLEPEEWMTFFIVIKYFVWLVGFTVMLNIIGVNVTMLIAGSSALLIGLGLGIQQYLYDMFAGLIILFEKKIIIGTVIELEDKRVLKITD
ncbi:MAG: mechanosensitive ion channel family protein, partial [Bacteroidales bacterium]|nr:mechanosensitive ion channel family protein [Bacteroidales bacterium]